MLATALLALAGPGDLWLAVAAIVLSNIFYGYGESLNAAFLPELARREALGRVSGWGWSFGYFGGMLTLGLSLAYVLWAQAQGIPATQFVPVTMLITAGVYALASLLTFALLKERAVPQPRRCTTAACAPRWQRLAQTWRQAQATATSSGCWSARWPTRPASRWSSRWPRCMPSRCWASSRRRP